MTVSAAFSGFSGFSGTRGIVGPVGAIGAGGIVGPVGSTHPTHPLGAQPKFGIGQLVVEAPTGLSGMSPPAEPMRIISYRFDTRCYDMAGDGSYVYNCGYCDHLEHRLNHAPGAPLVVGRWPEDAGLSYVEPEAPMTPEDERKRDWFVDRKDKLQKAMVAASAEYSIASNAYVSYSRECKHYKRTRYPNGVGLVIHQCADCGHNLGVERACPLPPLDGGESYDVTW